MTRHLTAGILALLALDAAAATPVRAPFPAPAAGEQRWVIQLPARSHEDQFQVVLVPSRLHALDCNVYRLQGQLLEQVIEGHGYSYYRYEGSPEVVGTLMACPQARKKTGPVYGAGRQVSYNSRLPLVVYLPKGLELSYRLWRAESRYSRARPD